MQLFRIIYHIFNLDLRIFLHHRADNVHLPPGGHFPLDKTVGLRPITLVHHTILDGQTIGRKLIDDGDIQIPVNDNSQSPGDRRGAHDQHMGMKSLTRQCLPLANAEPVLLVCHHQSQTGKAYLLLNQRMGSENNPRLTALNARISLPFLLGRHGSGQQLHAYVHGKPGKQLPDTLRMLSCQHLGGRHQRPLIAALHRRKQCQQRNDRLTGSHVSLHQPVHGRAGGGVDRHLQTRFWAPVSS